MPHHLQIVRNLLDVGRHLAPESGVRSVVLFQASEYIIECVITLTSN